MQARIAVCGWQIAAAAAAVLLACGCETMRVRGSIGYLDPSSGAKAGLEISDTGGGWWVRVPLPQGGTADEAGVLLLEGPIVVDRKSGK